MVIKEMWMDEQFTSFGTCNLMEDDCGDARLLEKILLCFLKLQERMEVKPNNEEKKRRSIFIIVTFRMERS